MSGWRRTLITVFIVVSVLAQVLQNLDIGYLPYPQERSAVTPAVSLANEARWIVESYGFYAGLNGVWRMFSPVHRFDWWWHVIATDPDGRDRELSTPSDTGRAGLESFFVDFRETKFLLNLWTRAPMQQAYIDHRCREEQHLGHTPASIRLEMNWRAIVPPDQAASRGDHRDPVIGTAVIAQRACERR